MFDVLIDLLGGTMRSGGGPMHPRRWDIFGMFGDDPNWKP
jgi:hypothetical protein